MTSATLLRSARKLAELWGGQAGNYLLTLLVVPHLIRSLGLETYGAFVVLQSTLLFGMVFIEYGFPVVANRQAALLRNSPSNLRSLVSSVNLLRILLWAIAVCLLVAETALFGRGPAIDHLALALGALGLFGTALHPQWILVGLGLAVQVGWLGFLWRALGVAGVLLLVHRPSDFALATAFTYLPSIGMALHARIWLKRRVGPAEPPRKEMLGRLALEGGSIFLATLGTMLYSTWNVLHLGRLGVLADAGIYGAAEKVVRVAAGAVAPVVQAILPRFASEGAQGGEQNRLRLDLVILGSFLAGGLASILLMACSGPIARFLSGSEPEAIASTLFRLAPVLSLLIPGLVVSHLALLAKGDSTFWMWLTLSVGAANLVALPFACQRFGAVQGTLLSTYACEAVVLTGCLARYFRNHRGGVA